MSAQRHHKMVDRCASQHLPETTIDWGDVCMQIDLTQQDVSCSTVVKQCKNKAPVSERGGRGEDLPRVLISNQLAHLNPALIH